MTDILEPILFKHNKPIKEKAQANIKQHVNFLTEQFIKTCFQIPKELETQYQLLGQQLETMPFQPEITDWINCEYRVKRYLGNGEIESYCEHPLHIAADILWAPICLRKECDITKTHDNP